MGDRELDVAECLERVRRRDEDAARELTEHLYPLVIKIVRSHLPRRLDEQDLAQDIFEDLCQIGPVQGRGPL